MEDIVMREGDWDSKITNKVKEGAVVQYRCEGGFLSSKEVLAELTA